MQGDAGRCRPAHLESRLNAGILPYISPISLHISAHLESRLDEHGAVAEQSAHVGEHATHARPVDHLGGDDDAPLVAHGA